MNSFVTLRSILLVLTLYISLIFNNSFSEFFQSQIQLFSLLLCFILAELLSLSYKFVFSQVPGEQIYIVNFLFAVLLLLNFPILLNYFIVFISLLVYFFIIDTLSSLFNVEDFSSSFWKSLDQFDTNYHLREQKGIFYSYYTLELSIPLNFLSSSDDKRACFDLIRNNEAILYYADSHSYHFSVFGKGCRFFSTTKNNLIKVALDIDRMNNNFNQI